MLDESNAPCMPARCEQSVSEERSACSSRYWLSREKIACDGEVLTGEYVFPCGVTRRRVSCVSDIVYHGIQ